MPRKVAPTDVPNKAWNVRIEIEPWTDGGYRASAPDLQGCWVIGSTVAEAVRDIYEVIEMSIESRLEYGEPIPESIDEISSDVGGVLTLQVPVGV